MDIEPDLDEAGTYEFHLWIGTDVYYCASELCDPADAGSPEWMACGVAGAGGALHVSPELRCYDLWNGQVNYCGSYGNDFYIFGQGVPRSIRGVWVNPAFSGAARFRLARNCEVLFDGEVTFRNGRAVVHIQ